jgi:branched-chain amino acid transport system permease protein
MNFSEDTILLFYEITDVIIAGLSIGSVYALMAVGMTLVYGVTKAFNFAYGDFFNMGGYFAWILIFGIGFQFGGYLTVLVIVMPLMFAVGYGLEKLMVAPLRKRADWENKVMMLTLGLALFLSSLYMVVFGVRMKSLPPIWEGTLEIGQLVFAYQDIMIFVMSLGGIGRYSAFWMAAQQHPSWHGGAGCGPEPDRR